MGSLAWWPNPGCDYIGWKAVSASGTAYLTNLLCQELLHRHHADRRDYISRQPACRFHHRSALWLALGRRVFGLMTLIREITHGLDIIVRPHLPQ